MMLSAHEATRDRLVPFARPAPRGSVISHHPFESAAVKGSCVVRPWLRAMIGSGIPPEALPSADGFLLKPYKLSDLRDRLRKLIAVA
jgi:hypothetical protein